MMGKWGARETGLCVVSVLISLSVAYYIGKKQGATDARLEINSTQLKKSDENIKTVQTRTDSSKAITAKLDSTHDIVRRKIKVVHDSILVHDSVVVVSPEIAQLIQSDDSLIAAQKRTLALDDTLIVSLRVGLNLRDVRISILEKAVTPSKVQRIITATKWIAIGAVIGAAYQHK